MSKQPPPAPTTSAVGPCPTVIQNVGRPGTGSLPSTIAPPDHPLARYRLKYCLKGPLNPKPTNQQPNLSPSRGWSCGAMVLGRLPVPGRPTIWIQWGRGLLRLQQVRVGVVWTFLLSSILSFLFLPLFGRRPDID